MVPADAIQNYDPNRPDQAETNPCAMMILREYIRRHSLLPEQIISQKLSESFECLNK
jgi:hypothetical protein